MRVFRFQLSPDWVKTSLWPVLCHFRLRDLRPSAKDLSSCSRHQSILLHARKNLWYPQGGYSGFQVTGMIEWSQKSRPKKIPRDSSKTPKNPWTKNWPQKNPMPILLPLKFPETGNAITQRKTLEIEHSRLFIHHTIWIYPFPHLILFNTPKKSLLKSSYPSEIFVPKEIPESKISNPKKYFDHPRHLKSTTLFVLNFAILVREYFSGFYFRDLNILNFTYFF